MSEDLRPLKERLSAVRDVRADLLPTKAAATRALGDVGQLIRTTCAVIERQKLGSAGHQALEHLVSAATLQLEVSSRLIAAHTAFAEQGAKLVPEINWGSGGGSPKQAELEEVLPTAAPLRVVG